MKKIREVLRLRYDHGSSTRQIALSCKLSVSTVSELSLPVEICTSLPVEKCTTVPVELCTSLRC